MDFLLSLIGFVLHIDRYLGPIITRYGIRTHLFLFAVVFLETGFVLRFFNTNHLEQTHTFYVRHGGKTMILARFIPVIRTFVPFAAGIGFMPYRRFFSYDVAGGITWVGAFTQ